MPRVGEFAVKLLMDATRFITGTRQVSSAAAAMNKNVVRSTGGLNESMTALNRQFQGVNRLLALGAGGGIVAGLVTLSRRVKEAAENATELQQQFRQGAINVDEMRLGLIKSVPVLGDVLSALEGTVFAVHDAFSSLSIGGSKSGYAALAESTALLAKLERQALDPKTRSGKTKALKMDMAALGAAIHQVQNNLSGLDASFSTVIEQQLGVMNRLFDKKMAAGIKEIRKEFWGLDDAVKSVTSGWRSMNQSIRDSVFALAKWRQGRAIEGFREMFKAWGTAFDKWRTTKVKADVPTFRESRAALSGSSEAISAINRANVAKQTNYAKRSTELLAQIRNFLAESNRQAVPVQVRI